MKETKFKTGDKVKIINDITKIDKNLINKTGEIKGIDFEDGFVFYLIQCDDFIEGFGNKKYNILSGYGVCCFEEEIEKI